MRRVVCLFLFFIAFQGMSQVCYGQKRLTITEHGAIGDGETDNTAAIAALMQKAQIGDTLYIPEGQFVLRTIRLKPGIHISGKGLLVQKLEKTEEYTNARQTSSTPLLHGDKVNNVYISVRTQSQNEAIGLLESKDIIIDRSTLQGDSTKLRSFAGILLFNSQNILIQDTEISHFGTKRQAIKTYQPGTGIRILSCNNIKISASNIHNNGENGVFMHGSRNVEISRSHFRYNGMSGIQVAFGSTGIEKNYKFSDNTMEFNAADAIDINNRSPKNALDINCYIQNNTSFQNGFVRGESTPDGSGIATLINVSGITMTDNTSRNNNRPALYLESCGQIVAKGNKADNQLEITKGLEYLYLQDNTFGNITFIADVKAKKIKMEDNTLNNLNLPNDITIDSLILTRNQIRNAALNFNLTGNIILKENNISSKAENVAIWIVKGSSFLLEKNEIESFKSTAVFVRKMAPNVQLLHNEIRSAASCIQEDGSKNLLVANNKLTSLPGGKTRYTFLSTNPQGLKMIGNEHTGVWCRPALALKGEGDATLIGEKILAGKLKHGKVNVTLSTE
jgi:hypothetical protein